MKETADAIDRLLSHLGTLLRYVAPGFAALWVIAVLYPKTKAQCFLSSGSPAVVVLGMLLGATIYGVTTAVPRRIWWFLIVALRLFLKRICDWLRKKEKCKWIRNLLTKEKCKRLCDLIKKEKCKLILNLFTKEKCKFILCRCYRIITYLLVMWKLVCSKMWELDEQRWLRRVSKSPKMKGLQDEMDKWAAMQNFLYCLSHTMILIPLWAWYRSVDSPEWWEVLFGGFAILAAALFSENRLTRKEMELHKKYPNGKENIWDSEVIWDV